MEESGKNRTPDKLPAATKEPLFAACNRHLVSLIEAFEPEWVVGVGAFAEGQAQSALAERIEAGTLQIGRVLHPSPANPRANRGWAEAAREELCALGICASKKEKGRKRA